MSFALFGNGGVYRTQALHEPVSGLQWVNDLVNFHIGRHVESFPLLVGSIDHLFEPGLAFLWIADGLKFFPVGKASGSFDAHCTEFPTGPGDGEERGMEAAACHGLRPKPIPFA